jgi:hypothetical protein
VRPLHQHGPQILSFLTDAHLRLGIDKCGVDGEDWVKKVG